MSTKPRTNPAPIKPGSIAGVVGLKVPDALRRALARPYSPIVSAAYVGNHKKGNPKGGHGESK